jgi:transposase InsO family protein
LGHQARWEYFRTIYQRYRGANRQEKQTILNEFCRNAGYHRKYAIRLLNGPRPAAGLPKRVRRRGYSYGRQALSILAEVWEAAAYPWSVRLKALLPKWLPWIRRRFRMSQEIERQLLRISARQMDRRLRDQKREKKRRIYGRTKPGLLLKHQIAVKTDSWDVTTPGFTEVDLVSHSGNSADGEFAHTLNVTDIHSTWTESRAVLGKGQSAVQEALNEVESALPFRLLGVDSDNGSEFINWHLKAWCEQKQIQLTRGRPYKKDDNAHVEQKNWTHVRKLLGWERYDSERAVEAMNDLYRHELRLWMNLFLPSVKLVRKTRVGSKLRRVYDRPQTPLERVASCPQADPQRLAELRHLERTVDPFHLGQVIERKLDRIYNWANRRWSPKLVRANAGKPTERANGCGKAAAWKPKNRVPTPLGNPANSAGFPLSHSHGGGRSVTSQMTRQPSRRLHS